MTKQTSSYDPTARRPVAGSRWVWEIDVPDARALIEVVTVAWNGEEWFVETKTLMGHGFVFGLFKPTSATNWNDLSRFWEACLPVGPARTRSGSPHAFELRRDDSVRPPVEDPRP